MPTFGERPERGEVPLQLALRRSSSIRSMPRRSTPRPRSCSAAGIAARAWEVISPVLTRDDQSKQQAGGSPSIPRDLRPGGVQHDPPHGRPRRSQKGVLWTGSDDGLVHVTRDGGKTWTNVSSAVPEDSDVYELEASPHDAGTAYVAVSRYRTANDFKPYLFKTTRLRRDLDGSQRQLPAGRDHAHDSRGHRSPGPALRRHRDRRVLSRSTTARPGRG